MADQFPTSQSFYDAEKDLRTVDAVSNSKDPDSGANIASWQTRTGGQTDTLAGRLAKLGAAVIGDTTTGCTLAGANEVVLNNTVGSDGFGNYYSWAGAFGHVVAPGTDPALVGSGYVPRTEIISLVQSREALRRSYAEAGLLLEGGSFEEGATLTAANSVVLYQANGKAYSHAGPYPFAVSAGTDPTAAVGYVNESNKHLRDDVVTISPFSSVSDYTQMLIEAISDNGHVIVSAGVYPISDEILCSAVGDNKKLTFMPGVIFESSQPPTTASPIFNLRGVGAGLRITGNGAVLRYTNAPTVRINHAVSVTGDVITDLCIHGLEIKNGGNMGIAVFCGPYGGVANGSHSIHIYDIGVENTLGDGVHVENADYGVRIHDIRGQSNGDDVVAVINYTGGSGAPQHFTPTKGVRITGIQSKDVRTSTVSLAGVENFVIDDINEECNASAAVLTLKLTHAAGYDVGNQFGVMDNIVTSGPIKVLALDTPGGGTEYNRNIVIGSIVGADIKDGAISLSNSGTSSDGRLKNISIARLDIQGGGASSKLGIVSNTENVHIGALRADAFSAGLLIANNADFSWGKFKMQAFQAGTVSALACVGNTNIRTGELEINAGNCTTGLQFQSNSGVHHDGLWSVKNAANNYLFGSNSDVVGAFDIIEATSFRGLVTAGTTEDISYSRAVPTGSAFSLSLTVSANEGLRWGVKNATFDKLTMLWTDTQNTVYVTYVIRVFAA